VSLLCLENIRAWYLRVDHEILLIQCLGHVVIGLKL
jgi:hypothetical protein